MKEADHVTGDQRHAAAALLDHHRPRPEGIVDARGHPIRAETGEVRGLRAVDGGRDVDGGGTDEKAVLKRRGRRARAQRNREEDAS